MTDKKKENETINEEVEEVEEATEESVDTEETEVEEVEEVVEVEEADEEEAEETDIAVNKQDLVNDGAKRRDFTSFFESKTRLYIIIAAVVLIFVGIGAAVYCSGSTVDRVNYDTKGYIELGEYKGLEVNEITVVEATDEEIDLAIAEDLETYVTYEDSDDPVADGDTVNISYVGTIDGEEFDGGTSDTYDLEIGSDTFVEGFEDGLIGMEVGDTETISVTFPDDYYKEECAGEDADFEVTINSIKSKTYPSLDDDFAVTMGYADLDAYKAGVKAELEANALYEAENAEDTRVFQLVYNDSEVIEYPEDQVNAIIKDTTEEFESYAAELGLEWDNYVEQYLGIEASEYDDTVKTYAESTVKNELVIYGIAQAEGIVISEEEYNTFIDEQLALSGFTKETYEETYGVSFEEAVGEENIYLQLYIDAVLETIYEYGVVTEASSIDDCELDCCTTIV